MTQAIISLLIGFFAGLLLVLRENRKEKINKLDKEDNDLKIDQAIIKEKKENIKEELKELDNHQAPSLQDSEIEDYWNKGKK
jgi:F0F1-type ATP synthase assembly protein I